MKIDPKKAVAIATLVVTFTVGGFKEIGRQDIANLVKIGGVGLVSFVAGWVGFKRPGDTPPAPADKPAGK